MSSLNRQILKKMNTLKMFGVAKGPEKVLQREKDLLLGNKPNNLRTRGIHSISTYNTYKKHALKFSSWERLVHPENKVLETMPKEHVGQWLKESVEMGKSGFTTRLMAASMAKIMECNTNSFGIILPSKKDDGSTITRSRHEVSYDNHFSEKNNAEIISFSEATGLRRSELEQIKPEQIKIDREGNVTLDFKSKKEYRTMTKGGRGRTVHPIKENWNVVINAKEKAESMGQERVFNNVHHAMDVHGYRATYAVSKYKEVIQDMKDKNEPIKNDYICRDGSGNRFNKIALAITSENLGHTRLGVVVKSYLYNIR